MADIAMLVAEEYERRVKNSRQRGAESEEVRVFASVSYLAQMVKGSFQMKNDSDELLNFVSEPKTQVANAAISGVFSA